VLHIVVWLTLMLYVLWSLMNALAEEPLFVERLHQAEADLLRQLASQLLRWQQQLRGSHGLPQPPRQGLELSESWEALNDDLNDPVANSASLDRLERIATRLQLCRLAAQAMVDAEANWSAIINPG
jgi:hypothetical protein